MFKRINFVIAELEDQYLMDDDSSIMSLAY